MKNIINSVLFLFVLVSLASCGEEDLVEYADNGLKQEINDPYLQINSQVISFQAGTESYDLSFNIINGTLELDKVNAYTVYTDAKTLAKSDKTLFKTYDVGADAKTEINDPITYDQLKDGVSVNGESLPNDQEELAIGSGWVMSFEGVTADGTIVPLGGNVQVAVLSKYAGLYEVVSSSYYRINVQSISWTGEIRFIGSVDENTFSYNNYWGPFAWTGSSFNFDLNLDDFTITAPILVDGALFSGNRAVGCHTEPEIFVDVPCDGSNVLIEDPDGNHTIKITYGYFTDGSGSRQFYEELVKI